MFFFFLSVLPGLPKIGNKLYEPTIINQPQCRLCGIWVISAYGSKTKSFYGDIMG